jgi:hypothetical protein
MTRTCQSGALKKCPISDMGRSNLLKDYVNPVNVRTRRVFQPSASRSISAPASSSTPRSVALNDASASASHTSRSAMS